MARIPGIRQLELQPEHPPLLSDGETAIDTTLTATDGATQTITITISGDDAERPTVVISDDNKWNREREM